MDISTLINTLGTKIENQDLTNLKIGDYKMEFNVVIDNQPLEVQISWRHGCLERVWLFNRQTYMKDPTSTWENHNINMDSTSCSNQQFQALQSLFNLARGKTTEWKVRDLFASWTNVKV